MGKLGLVGIDEIMNIRLQVFELELQITAFYVHGASLFT